MDDEKIIELFFMRSEEAIRELDDKYGHICRSVSYNILHNRADAEECVNDAYWGTWNAIPPAKPRPLCAFVCKVVRNISLKRHAYTTAAKRNSVYDVTLDELENCLSSSATVEDEFAQRELAAIIEGFLDSLSPENRVIFLRRYWFSDPYSRIAQQVGLTEKNVSVRLARIRKALRAYLAEREVLL